MYLPANFHEGRYITNLSSCQAARRRNILSNDHCSTASQRTYTVEQAAAILGVSLRKAYYLCEATTEFKVIHLGRRCLRVHKESFDRWLDGGGGDTA